MGEPTTLTEEDITTTWQAGATTGPQSHADPDSTDTDGTDGDSDSTDTDGTDGDSDGTDGAPGGDSDGQDS